MINIEFNQSMVNNSPSRAPQKLAESNVEFDFSLSPLLERLFLALRGTIFTQANFQIGDLIIQAAQ